MSLSNIYATNRAWSDRYIDQISEILRANAMTMVSVSQTDDEVDKKQATDFVVKVNTGTVAARIRRPNISYRDLTIRSWLKSGAKTELQKIREGYGDWYLYAWTTRDGLIGEFMLVDLNMMRETGLIYQDRQTILNKDKASGFVKYCRSELRRGGYIVCEDNLTQQSVKKKLQEPYKEKTPEQIRLAAKGIRECPKVNFPLELVRRYGCTAQRCFVCIAKHCEKALVVLLSLCCGVFTNRS